MREIKFRIWDKEEKTMRLLSTAHDTLTFKDGVAKYYNLQNGDGNSFESSGYGELMQFTGLHDKNGAEIYEGDIIKAYYANTNKVGDITEIKFVLGRFEAVKKFGEQHYASAPIADGIPRLKIDKRPYMEFCEVLGNIHDNPELLDERVEVN